MSKRSFKVFESNVLRRIFGLNKEEIIAGWRKLHAEGIRNLKSSLNILR